jgi:tetratricopeptide (TPR) repeat protein
VEANIIGVGNIVPPFWKRLHDFFLYPLKLQPLLFILIISGLSYFFASSFLVTLVLSVAMLKYSYVVLKNTAQGSLTAPDITLATLNEELELVFKQVVIIVMVFTGSGIISARFGPLAGIFFWGAAILCLPAMIMSLAATNRLVHALNPMVFVAIISRIGSGYFLMYLFLLFLLGAPAALISQAGRVLPLGLTVFLYIAAKNYYMVMSYNLMGYAMLQYHQEIGYQVDYEKFIKGQPAAEKNPHEALLNEVDVLVKDGKIDAAILIIRNSLPTGAADLQLSERYYNLLRLQGNQSEIAEHASSYLDLLVKENQKEKACNLYSESVAADAGFTPRPATLFKLAEWQAWRRDPKEALNSLLKFTKSYKDHPLLPDVYFFLAKFLHTRMDNHAKAKEILAYLTRHYANHEVAGSAQKYLQQIA